MDWDEVKRARERLAREQGTIVKDWGGRFPIALIYPNTYYVGMSNLGLHAVYSLFNRHPKFVCERAFWEKGAKESILSLESQRPLPDFAVLAFSVTFELDYFHVAHILKSAGIPLYAAERDERHPLVIAGGPCITANPMPLAPFFDCLCIGEAEAILPAMLPVLSEGITGHRANLLKALACVPGIYVPAYPPTRVVRQWARNLDDFPVHSTVLTPDTELGDMYLVEVERGCNWRCRFCLVSNAYRPMRLRSIDSLLEQAKEGLGYRKRLGLMGPAVTDHPRIEELLDGLLQMGARLAISSLRITSLTPKILQAMTQGGIKSITIAPEAGSERLRQIINKGICEADILNTVSMIAGQSMKEVKLYFMIGLPSETDEDIEEIAKLTIECKTILDRQSGARLTLNVSPFVPKADTPFCWLPMAEPQVINQRISRLKSRLQPKGIRIKSESPAWSEVQAVLARGDTELARVLADIREVSLSGWRRTIEKHGINADFYAHQKWDTGRKLPWAVIDSGTKSGALEWELNKALSGTAG